MLFWNSLFHVFSVSLAAPYIVSISPTRYTAPGLTLTLECEVWGFPLPTVIWLRSIHSGSRLIPRGTVREIPINETVIISQLIFSSVTVDDEGIYTCNASNPLGEDSDEVEVIVAGERFHLLLTYMIYIYTYSTT